jgi:predicted Zn-dependent peptidase
MIGLPTFVLVVLAALATTDFAAFAKTAPEVQVSGNVFVVPDPYAKTVTGTVIINAGCADERGGCQGLAHYLEHLQFINRDGGHQSRVTLFANGSGNGWTSHRATAYFQSFPVEPSRLAENLDKLIGHLAEILRDVRSGEVQAVRERTVVMQEYNFRIGNNAAARFAVRRSAALLRGDPLGASVIGSPETIAAFDTTTAVAFHRDWYAPHNVAFVVTGPVAAEDVRPLVAKHVDTLPPRPIPDRTWWRHPPPPVEQITLDETDRDQARTWVYVDKLVVFDPPSETHVHQAQNAARSIVNTFLQSRLNGAPVKRFVEDDGLATQASFGVSYLRRGMMRVSFSGTPATGVTPERLAEAALQYVATLSPDLIDADYLARLKRRGAIGDDLLREEPNRYAQALVNWFGGNNSYEYWKARERIAADLDLARVHEMLALVARPGRTVTGILRAPERR